MPVVLLYAITVLVWGLSWYAIEMQLGVVAPEVSVAWRMVLAAVLLFAFCAATGRRLRYPWRDHAFFAAQGLTLFCLNYILFYVAGSRLASGLMAVCFSTILVMNMANGTLFFRQTVDRSVAAGGGLGILGLALVFWPEVAGVEVTGGALVGLGLSLAATYSASLGNMVSVRHKRAGIPVIESNAFGMAYGAALCLLFAFARGAAFTIEPTLRYLGALVYLSVFATVIGFGCFLTLLQRIGADRAAYATVLFPVVALGVSTLVEDYRWTWPAAAGVALVLVGNVLVLLRRRRPVPARLATETA
ncbi:MAG: DMT family transporter [Rhodospirillaceae bacterium]|nr:DMT family transporter [Rhodospirillaceae bacterium]